MTKTTDAAPADNAHADVEKMSFEQALKELETIVAQLESGEAPLEQSINLYERGNALKMHCEARLKSAEMRVEKIILDARGPSKTGPLETP